MDMGTLWNALLTVAMGLVGWNWASMSRELQRVTILLNRTREEMVRDYATKTQIPSDMSRISDRLNEIERKLDRLLELRK